MLRYALLGFLNYQPLTGYELKQFMDSSTSFFWYAKLSQVYTTLKSLESEGLLDSRVEAQAERPDRRVYSLNERGAEELRSWLARAMTELEPQKNTFLLRLFFSGESEKENLLAQLHLMRQLHQEQLEVYTHQSPEVIRQTAARSPGLARHAMLWEATRRFGEMYEEMFTRWLEETIEVVHKNFT